MYVLQKLRFNRLLILFIAFTEYNAKGLLRFFWSLLMLLSNTLHLMIVNSFFIDKVNLSSCFTSGRSRLCGRTRWKRKRRTEGKIYFICFNLSTLPGDSRGIINTFLTNKWVVGSNGERTNQLMFYVIRGLIKRFSGGLLISVSFSATDLLCLVKDWYLTHSNSSE